MANQQLAPSRYARALTEAAATALVSHPGDSATESATEAFSWAIGDPFTFEQAMTLLVDQALKIHERQLAEPVDLPDPGPASLADWLPTGSDDEDRILSLLSLALPDTADAEGR